MPLENKPEKNPNLKGVTSNTKIEKGVSLCSIDMLVSKVLQISLPSLIIDHDECIMPILYSNMSMVVVFEEAGF